MEKGVKWYKKASNWIIIIASVILIPILIINLSIMIQAHSNKDKVPSVFGYKPFIVLSGSMETEIHKGDLIITKVIEPSTLKVDDIIAFRDEAKTVTTHRIIDIITIDEVKYFVTKGDNNNTQDKNLVEFADVEGIYIGRIPVVGSIMSGITNPTTIIIIVLGITVIFVTGFSISSKKERDKELKEFLEYKKAQEELAKKETEKSSKKKAKPKKKASSKSGK